MKAYIWTNTALYLIAATANFYEKRSEPPKHPPRWIGFIQLGMVVFGLLALIFSE